MNSTKLLNGFKWSILIVGISTILFSLFKISESSFNWNFLAFTLITITITSRMSLKMPRLKFAVSFSDSMIFLTFLIFDGYYAVIIATIDMLMSCLYLRATGHPFKKMIIAFNVGMAAISTTITHLFFVLSKIYVWGDLYLYNTTNLLKLVSLLAFIQFLSSTVLATIYYSLKTNENFVKTWKNECYSSSLTQIAGACLALVIFKLISYANPLAIIISVCIFCIAYFNYRRTITEMTESIEQAEQAEREKAEAETRRAEEAEKYARELALLLKIEEETSQALRKSRKEFKYAAMHDSLTNLPNRAFFAESLKKLIDENKGKTKFDSFVIFIDLARFKKINDSLGHTIGDKVLMIVAKRFLKALRPTDFVARLGGDEFAILLNGLANVEKAEKVAWKIHQKISQPFSLSGNKINVGINIGIAPCDAEYETPEEILRDADIAMHYAKKRGSGVEIFNKELRKKFVQLARIESELPFAIERNELAMHYQPLISLKDGSLIGFEALLRWYHRDRGFISPGEFIPVAEDTGQIVPITTWILKETCRQLGEWQKISYATRDLMMSVNISGKHLGFQSLLVDVEEALAQAKIQPSHLKLEITESAAMDDVEQTIRMLANLKSLGVQLSIDDFGTGYSSLSYLHKLPFDTLKIDRSFVSTVGSQGENSEILRTIISLAKNLQMRVIAEGIETEAQLELLQVLGCDYGQGFLMSKPLPKEQIDELLYQKLNWLPVPPKNVEIGEIQQINDKNVSAF